MQKLRVSIPGREYDIKIGRGLLTRTGELISELNRGCRAFVVTDTTVEPLYCKRLLQALSDAGFDAAAAAVPAGEKSKSMEMLNYLYGELLKFGITRTDFVIALGGGVVGDLTGFCAATLLRGIPFIQLPTTLLAQVDSSIGGKVAVNLPYGKNLAGAFYQPKAVIIDPDCLDTLSDRIFSDGMAEVIKYGAILDEKLFDLLDASGGREGLSEHIEDVIYRCCDLKRMVVENDELDTGGRMILNFGHTFGHAIEKKYNFSTYTHGEAVACGMVMAAEYGEKTGVTPCGTADRIKSILKKYKLPASAELDAKSLLDAVKVDKKGDGDTVNLILLEKTGRAVIKKIQKRDLQYGHSEH